MCRYKKNYLFLKRYDFNGRTKAIGTLAGASASMLADSLYTYYFTQMINNEP